METSVKAAEVLVPPQPDVASSSSSSSSSSSQDDEGEAAAPPAVCSSSSDYCNPMEEFSSRLEDIISTYGSAASLMDKQSLMEAEMERMKEAKDDVRVAMETEVSVILQSLNNLSSPEKKLEELVRKYAELAALQRSDERKLQQLQADGRSSVAARSKLETLCRELQRHYNLLREETLQRCREDEERRTEMVSHFQTKLTEIQAQIEQHSARNDKLCHENINLTDKLESLMSQCELREESLEKINKRRDLQQKLTEAKLQQANALLSEAEEKHKREKEYLLREAIDKTKKCFAMKEQELAMKKKLTLYAQKFDEFQATLAKSNEIYARFKKEMDNMSDKMKKMEKESNLWKTRFENCNKALTDMIEERTEKSKEYDLFVLKIQKLEKLCRALQDERVVLYDKIKEVRLANSIVTSRATSSNPEDEAEDKSALTPVELQELQELQEEDPVLTEDMSRLKEEQAKLREFAASLLAEPADDEEEKDAADLDTEEDLMASAFVQFQTKSKTKEAAAAVDDKPEEVRPENTEEAPKPEAPVEDAPEEPAPADEGKLEDQVEVKLEDQVEDKEVKPAEENQQKPAEPTPEPEKVQVSPEKVQVSPEKVQVSPEKVQVSQEKVQVSQEKVQVSPETDLKAEAAEVKPVEPVQDQKVQAEPAQETPTKTESELSPKTTSSSSSNSSSSKKQTPKKKKKRIGKSTS